ncbi:MAG: class IV adenylate cyclase [Phycisphaerales bacterium]
MQSLEFKAELRDPEIARAVCRRLGAVQVGRQSSVDTYFRVANGRLKKREAAGDPVEWVFYHRPDRTKPKLSHFTIYSEQQARERFGAAPLPVWIVVRRTREIWLKDWVRINLDEVDGLGWFLEFETLVSRDRELSRCQDAIASLRPKFAPILGEPLSTGYAELLAMEAEHDQPRAAG